MHIIASKVSKNIEKRGKMADGGILYGQGSCGDIEGQQGDRAAVVQNA